MAAGRAVIDLAGVAGGELAGPERGRDAIVDDVTHDSRQAGPRCLYVAIRGAKFDGHHFVADAVAAGSPAVCVSHPTASDVPEIVVGDTRRALGPLAASVHHDPSVSMKVIGVTGTNGKTTVAHYIGSIGASAAVMTGVIGTIHTKLGDTRIEAVRTTPEASDFQRLLAEMRDRGAEMVAVEVSSHGLDMGRVAATRFAVGAFTNLSQDHLDFHGDMKSYLAAKRRLFEEYELGAAVINIDDAAGARIADDYPGELITVGRKGDIRAANRRNVGDATSFDLITPWGQAELTAPLVGEFNVDNAALAAGCVLAAGLELGEVVKGLESLEGVPGRFEVVSGDDPILVIIDYAHTPEGISKAISAAREMNKGRVIALVGAGGDRDREKRPLMGAAASAADLAIITSDNPRSEDPGAIAHAVLEGVTLETGVIYELDRRAAIHRALTEATDGDVVLVLGRGHEPTQEIGGERLPFDDRQVARQALTSLRMSTDSGPKSGSID